MSTTVYVPKLAKNSKYSLREAIYKIGYLPKDVKNAILRTFFSKSGLKLCLND